jgi:cystathionine beta-synthase
MPFRYDSIVDTIGNTPLIKIRSLSNENVTFYAKVEMFNPGGSSKDRIAVPMIDDAEKEGKLKPGGTIIEATSGNTGLALALVGIQRGYRVILVLPDKMSPEKINLVKAIGCEVIVCPTEVEPDDPRSYYKVAESLSTEIPNSFWARQYWNESNPKAHYEKTGPEIWEATEGQITHWICGVGTGGTISGVSRYLKEKNPNIKAIAPDPEGSILAHYHKYRNTEIQAKSYKVEGVGEDIIPSNVDFDVIDEFITVGDAEAFEWTRKLARNEGLMVGGSSGLAVAGAVKYNNYPKGSVVVILLPDTGERYLGKIYNDSWMRIHGFLPAISSVKELITSKPPNLHSVKIVTTKNSFREVLNQFRKFDTISQLILDLGDGDYGVIHRRDLYRELLQNSKLNHDSSIKNYFNGEKIRKLPLNTPVEELKKVVLQDNVALIVENSEIIGLLTMKDLVENLGY